MSDETQTTPTLEELEERAATRKKDREKLENAQRVIDLLAREDLESQHDMIAAVRVARFVEGFPTQALVKGPSDTQYKRYKDQTFRAAEKKNIASSIEAQELLAKACWIYPAPKADGQLSDAQLAMLKRFPGILTAISNSAIALAEGKAVDEGKG